MARSRSNVLLGVWFLVAFAGAARAQGGADACTNVAWLPTPKPPFLEPISGALEAPLLRVRAHLLFPDGELRGEKVVVVYRSGKAAMFTLATTVAVDDLATADRARLLDELAAARVGFVRDCTLDETVGLNGLRGTVQVTWYGQGRRTNDFTVSMAAQPTCPSAVQRLVFFLVLELRVHETT
jgi:hypothetical protein